MVRLKIKAPPLGWMMVVAGVAAAAAVYAAGFVYAGTLAAPADFTPLARLMLLASTVVVTLGVARIVKEQQRELSARRDAWLFSGALAALSWVVLVRPALADADAAFRLFRVAFALVDIGLAAMLVLLAIPQSGYKLRRVRVAGMVHLAATTVFALTGLRSTFSFTSPLVLTCLGFYVVLAVVGLRGRLQRAAQPEPESARASRAAMRSARVAVLSAVPVASGVAAAIAVAAEPRSSAMAVAALAAVLTTLAAVRLRELHTADSKLVDSLRDQCDELQDRNASLAAEAERAWASLREATDFLTDMTERVATPLNGVLEAGDELHAAMRGGAPIVAPVEKLVRSSDTLLFIVNDLLGIAEATAKPVPLPPAAFSPHGLMVEVGEAFVERAAARGVDFAVVTDEALPAQAMGQRNHIESVLRIFVDNAVNFANRGEIELTTAFIERRVDNSIVVRFSVRDNGVGMSRDQRQALLAQPVDSDTSTRRYRTKPHGLALVPALVGLVGGDWGVESEPGRGSTFWFSTVLQPVAAVETAPVAETETTSLVQAAPGAEPARVAPETAAVFPAAAPAAPAKPPIPETAPVAAAVPQVPEPTPVDDTKPVLRGQPEGEPEASVEPVVSDPEPEPVTRTITKPEPTPRVAAEPAPVVAAKPTPTAPTEPKRPQAGPDTATKPATFDEPEPPAVVFRGPEPGDSAEPRDEDDVDDAEDELDEEEEAAPEPPVFRMRGRILLADDNPLNRRVTLATLRSVGFRVEVATNGAEAVEALTVGAYDAVLMDCEMPVLDGFDATIAIRDQERGLRHTPIIALTAHATHDDQLRAAAVGMDDFIAKPFEARQLLVKLAKWIPQNARSHAT